jgi:DNA-binding response OmpR family regulator
LLAEDNLSLARFLQPRLEAESCHVQHAADAQAASEALKSNTHHVLIADLNLPHQHYVSLIQQVRSAQPRLVIVALTPSAQVEERVAILDAGADDCLPKPFALSELTARVRSLLRRNPIPSSGRLQVDDLVLDGQGFRVERAGKRIDLSGKEFSLLEYLMRNARKALTRAMIMENVWNMPFDPSTNLVDVYVKYVRDKIDTPEFPTRLIRTVRGVGYVLSEA